MSESHVNTHLLTIGIQGDKVGGGVCVDRLPAGSGSCIPALG